MALVPTMLGGQPAGDDQPPIQLPLDSKSSPSCLIVTALKLIAGIVGDAVLRRPYWRERVDAVISLGW